MLTAEARLIVGGGVLVSVPGTLRLLVVMAAAGPGQGLLLLAELRLQRELEVLG